MCQFSLWLRGLLSGAWVVCLWFSVISLDGCRETHSSTAEEWQLSSSVFVPRAHLPGTLLRDHWSRHWMVMAWPERAPIAPSELRRTHLDQVQAVSMSAVEELCLRDRGLPWRGREGWELIRQPDGHYWYVSRSHELRREASLAVIRSWHDDPAAAQLWDSTQEVWHQRYRDLGPLSLANGTLIRADQTLYYFLDGQLRPFASTELAQAAGYSPSQALAMSFSEMRLYGELGLPLTADVFLVCPWAAAQAQRENDEDGDGANRALDCDDHDAHRAPHLLEFCDGVDNNCDGVVDEGFRIGLPCTLDDSCQSPGTTSCAPDRWGVTCRNDDALCW